MSHYPTRFVQVLIRRQSNLLIVVLIGAILSALQLAGTSASAQTCTATPAGVVSWWAGEGDAHDSMGANDGALQNGAGFGSGEVGQAFSLAGTGDHVFIPASPSLNVGAGSGFTIEAWINPADVSTGHPIFEWNSGGYGVCLWVANWGSTAIPGSLYGDVKDNGLRDHAFETAGNLLTINTFQHVAFTYDKASGVAALYINGLVSTQQNVGTLTPFTGTDAYIGYRIADGGAGSGFPGQIDEVSLYSRALSSNEIQSIFLAGTAGKCAPSAQPLIWLQPKDRRIRIGDNVTMTAGAQGAAPLSYQWLWYGTNFPDATNSVLSFANAQPSNSGPYTFTVTNSYGFAVSSNAILQVDAILAYANNVLLTNAQNGFSNSTTIRMQNGFGGGPIFFTLDGSTPTVSSPIYGGPFVISSNVVLQALAYSSDFSRSGTLAPINLFILPVYSLLATSSGGGSINLSPAGGSYLSNTMVTATAVPASGWTFLQWMGDVAGANNPTTVTMTRAKTIRAVFGTTLTPIPPSGGSIALNPSNSIYPYGGVVNLSAIPNPGNYFVLWGSAASGNTNPLSFTVTNANPSVSALFGSVPSGQAALTVVPIGDGRVSVNPRANIYTLNQSATITATPDAGQSFLGWSGSASGVQNPLTVLMNSNKLIYANFTHGAILSCRSNYEGLKAEGFVFTLTGDVGAYELEASSNLALWRTLGLVTNSFGSAQFTDFSATNSSRQYYRAMVVP